MIFKKLAGSFGKQIIRDPIGHFKNGLLYRYYKGKPLELNLGPGSKPIYTISSGKRKGEPLTPPPTKRQKQSRSKDMLGTRKKGQRPYNKNYKNSYPLAPKKRRKLKRFKTRAKPRIDGRAKGIQRQSDELTIINKYKPSKRSKMAEWAKQPLTYEQTTFWSCASGASTATQSTQIISSNILAASNVALGGSEMLIELFNRHSKIQNTTGPATITVDPTFATQRYNSLYLKTMNVELNLTNQAPTTVEADVYVVTRKHTADAYAVNDSQSDWQNGLTVMNAAGAVLGVNYLDTKPTMSKRFNLNWKIVAKYKLKLDAGQERKCTYKVKVGRMLDTDYIADKLGGIKGIYHEIFVVARGPTADATNGFAAGAIATTKVKIVGTCRVVYTSYAVQQYSRLHYQATNLTTSNTNLYSIADAAGTVVNTETAAGYA